ncbi:MAG: Vacuolar H+transporting two-sector ATPase F subunit [Betaproteobacteria bacterium]
MTAVAYLGNRLDAAGFRLAGVAADCPPPGAESAALARALAEAELVLLDADLAQRLPAAELEAALARLSPLVAIVPGAAPCPLAPVERVRRQLGLEA